jgi:hypothetical protein
MVTLPIAPTSGSAKATCLYDFNKDSLRPDTQGPIGSLQAGCRSCSTGWRTYAPCSAPAVAAPSAALPSREQRAQAHHHDGRRRVRQQVQRTAQLLQLARVLQVPACAHGGGGGVRVRASVDCGDSHARVSIGLMRSACIFFCSLRMHGAACVHGRMAWAVHVPT